jgi:hypothetical protein
MSTTRRSSTGVVIGLFADSSPVPIALLPG